MKTCLFALAAALVGLMGGTASACPYNTSAVAVVATPVFVTTPAVTVATTATVVTPSVVSTVAVTPVFATPVFVTPVFATPVFVNTFHGSYGRNVAVVGDGNVNVQRGLANVAIGGGGKGGNVNVQKGLLNVRLGR